MPMEISHVWLGRFSSEAALDEYFEESYDDDDAPINRFATDQDESFCDHDWVERNFKGSGDLRALIKGHSYSVDYIDDVIAKASTEGITNANTFIMADKNEFQNPRSLKGEGYVLWYMGAFNCNI